MTLNHVNSDYLAVIRDGALPLKETSLRVLPQELIALIHIYTLPAFIYPVISHRPFPWEGRTIERITTVQNESTEIVAFVGSDVLSDIGLPAVTYSRHSLTGTQMGDSSEPISRGLERMAIQKPHFGAHWVYEFSSDEWHFINLAWRFDFVTSYYVTPEFLFVSVFSDKRPNCVVYATGTGQPVPHQTLVPRIITHHDLEEESLGLHTHVFVHDNIVGMTWISISREQLCFTTWDMRNWLEISTYVSGPLQNRELFGAYCAFDDGVLILGSGAPSHVSNQNGFWNLASVQFGEPLKASVPKEYS